MSSTYKLSLMGASFGALLCALAPFAASAQAQAQDQAQSSDADAAPTEVVVTGQRLSSANSINQQKRATAVTNVISSDDMGKLPDANAADALARVPGVNVVVNQETGEGEYVAIRGFGGKLTVGELAERLAIKPHSAVGMADRLVESGLVVRQPGSRDRRQVMLRLTGAGQRKLAKLSKSHREELKRLAPLLKALLGELGYEGRSRRTK